jgi:hypothetical protein
VKSLALQNYDEILSPAPGWCDGAGEPFDYCTRDGALALKTKIEAYWRERGQVVTVAMANVGFHPAIRAARYDVRSDMVNGMPRAPGPKKPVLREVFAEDLDNSEDDLEFE